MVHSFVDQQFVRNFNSVEIGSFCSGLNIFTFQIINSALDKYLASLNSIRINANR